MQTLSEAMEFDHVIEVLDDGTWRDAGSFPHAPDALDVDPYATTLGEWELPLSGMTGQYGYNGPWLHDSELIEGGVERRILEQPGYWVAIYGMHTDEDGPEVETIIEGWTAAFCPTKQAKARAI